MQKTLCFLMVLALTGCNSYFNNSYQKIAIHTPGVENVDCLLETEFNKYRMLTPGRVEVDRSRHPMTITCQKINYVMAVKTIESKIRMKESQMNVFNGILPGVAYDVASNSIYAYPDAVIMEMKPVPVKAEKPVAEVSALKQKKEPVKAPPDDGKAAATFSGTSKK